MTKWIKVALVVALLVGVVDAQHVVVRRGPGGEPPGTFPYTNNFSADPFSNSWTKRSATARVAYDGTNDVIDFATDGSSDEYGAAQFDEVMASEDQCACFTISSRSSDYAGVGVMLRAPASIDTVDSIHLWAYYWWEGSGSARALGVAVMDQGSASHYDCDVLYESSGDLITGDRLCFQVDGTGAYTTNPATGTSLRVWRNPTVDCATGETPYIDYDEWTEADGDTCLTGGKASTLAGQYYTGLAALDSNNAGTHEIDNFYAKEM